MITSISSYMSDINLSSFFNNENIRHKIMITYLLLDLRRLLVAYTVLKGLGEEFIFALFFQNNVTTTKKITIVTRRDVDVVFSRKIFNFGQKTKINFVNKNNNVSSLFINLDTKRNFCQLDYITTSG